MPFELADAVDAKNPDGTAVKRLFDDLGERQKQARASLGCNNPGTATFSAARMSTTTSTLSEPAPTVGKGRTRVH